MPSLGSRFGSSRFGSSRERQGSPNSASFAGSPILALRRRAQRRVNAEPVVHASWGALGESSTASRPFEPSQPMSDSHQLLAMPTPVHGESLPTLVHGELSDGETRVIFMAPRRLINDVATDFQQYLHTHYDPAAADAPPSDGSQGQRPSRSQQEELDALTARLHGLRLLLTLSQALIPLPCRCVSPLPCSVAGGRLRLRLPLVSGVHPP